VTLGAATWLALAVLLGVVAAGATAGTAVKGKYSCHGNQITLFNNSNVYGVDDGGTPPTFSTHGKAYCLTYIETYHWNDGNGQSPGTVGLKQMSVPIITLPHELGPYHAKGSSGQGGAPNVNWYADVPQDPPKDILDGRYECVDSGEGTWSSNKQSGGQGFCIVYAVPASYAIAH
jgi:hypothetical protein